MNIAKISLASAVFAAALMTSLFNTPVSAGEINGISFADKITVGGKSLTLNGLGLRQATFLKVNVYAGALYLETPSHDGEKIIQDAGLKRIEMTFMRDVGSSKISDAWAEGFEKNCTEACDTMKAGIAKLQEVTIEMNRGDKMTFSFFADHVDVSVKGMKAVTIEGKEFSRNMLRVWLGKNPPNSGLKDGMLGNKS